MSTLTLIAATNLTSSVNFKAKRQKVSLSLSCAINN